RRDHRRIVRAQARGRDEQAEAVLLPGGAERFAQRAVGGHAAGELEMAHAEATRGVARLGDERVDDRALEARAQGGERGARGAPVLLHPVRHPRLEPAEAEVEIALARHRTGHAQRARIAAAGEALDRRAAGIAEPEELRDLVERLAGGVVARAPELAVAPV